MADKNTTSNINLAAAEELPKAQSKFKEFVKKFMLCPLPNSFLCLFIA